MLPGGKSSKMIPASFLFFILYLIKTMVHPIPYTPDSVSEVELSEVLWEKKSDWINSPLWHELIIVFLPELFQN